MKGIVLIVSLFLSGVLGGIGHENGLAEEGFHETVVAGTDGDTTENEAGLNDFAILPVRTASYSGTGYSSALSLRSVGSGRRIQPSTKSTFRVMKDGKVLDRNNSQTFRADILKFQSGIRSNSRYIYSICQLLI